VEEEWKVIEDFQNYAVSNIGRVKRIRPSRGGIVGSILKPKVNRTGYHYVNLRGDNGSHKGLKIHSLVLIGFGPPRPYGHESNHKDCCKANNCISNLEWVSHKENMEHASSNGRMHRARGWDGPLSKLKPGEVWLIRKLLKSKIQMASVAPMFMVHVSTICRIKHNNSYKDM
jgi:hypothetical protein